LNDTLNVIEVAASYISEYHNADYSAISAFKGETWAIALIHHLREVVVGLFERVDDFSNKHTFAKNREVYEVITMFNVALRNALDRRIESPAYLRQILRILKS